MATRPVDEKIVVMKLDNSDFKQKAVETTSIFGKLRDSLNKIPGVNLGKTVQEVGALKEQTNGMNFNSISANLQTITSRFSTLGIVGVTALTNITNKAVDAGTALVKSLTVEQVSSGFDEYETKMKAIGTMLANTEWAGSTLDDVKKTLGELNDYADQTIYNFAQMTENIGRFTAAGVTLEDSATAIKGLGNLAAISGSDVNQLNTAMYQMSQALASGKLNLEDWNSLVNAGMAGKKTQDALVATARAMGHTVNLTDGFRNSIQDGWLTSEVLLQTLKKFGEDESMTQAATAVRTFSGAMDALKEGIGSGWATTFEHIFGDFEEATELWTGLSQAVGGWFSETAEARNKLVEGIAKGGGFLNIFDGIQNAVKPVVQLFEAMGAGLDKAFPPKTVAEIVKLTESFKAFTSGLKLSEETMSKLTTIFHGGFAVISSVIEVVKALERALINLVPPGAGNGLMNFLINLAEMSINFNKSIKEGNALTDMIAGLGVVLSAIGGFVSDAVKAVFGLSGSLTDRLGSAVDWIGKKLAPVREWFKEAFSDFGGDDLLGAGTLAGVIALLTTFGSKVMGIFDGFGDVTESIGDTFDGLTDAIQGFAMGIKIANLVLIAGAIATLAVSLKLLEGIETEDLTKGLTSLAIGLGIMMGALAVISKFNLVGGMGASMTLIAIATSVSILASALGKIEDLNPEQLKTSILALTAIVGILSASIIAMSKMGGKIGASSMQLIELSGAVYILASAVKEMSSIDSGELKTSLITLTLIFAGLAGFLKVASGTKFGPGAAIGVIAISGAVHMMVSAIEKISDIDVGSLTKGLMTIGVILTQLTIFSKVAGGPGMVMGATGMLLIAGALNAMMGPIQTFSTMGISELAVGLTAMGVALAAVAAAGLLASGAIGGALAITTIALALNLLVDPILALSTLSWEELIKGFVGLGVNLAILAGAAMLLTPVIPSMLGFAAAVTLMGVGMLAAGAGIGLFGAGLATLATLTAASVASLVAALALLLKGFADLIPAALEFVVELGLALIDGIVQLVPAVAEGAAKLIIGILQALTDHLPKFLELGTKLVVQILEGIGEHAPTLISAAVDLIINLINGMADAIGEHGPRFIDAVFNLLSEIIILIIEAGAEVIDSLLGWIPGVSKATASIGDEAEEYLREHFGAGDAARDKGNEFVEGLNSKAEEAKTAGKNVGESASSGMKQVDYLNSGSQAGGEFAKGLNNSRPTVENAAKMLANDAKKTIDKTLGIQSPAKETEKSGEWTGEGFSKGMKKKSKKVKKTAKQLATDAKQAFNAKMDTAEYKFKMGEIDSAKYIKEIEKIRDAYKKYPALVQDANLEILKIEKEMAKEKEALRKKEFENSKSFISDRKYFNEMSLMEELSTWERLMARYAKGTAERKEAEREVYRIKNEINQKILSLSEEYTQKMTDVNDKMIEDIKALNDAYDTELSNVKNSLYSFAGLFDEVTQKTEITGQQLMDNLKGQLTTFSEWSANLANLGARGIDSTLLDELRNMGPKAASEIAALNTLTDAQLTEYSGLWKSKNEMARVEAVKQLEGLRQETDSKILEIRTQSEKQLEIYKTEWIKKITEIRVGTGNEFLKMKDTLRNSGVEAMNGMMVGMESKRSDLLALAQQIADEIAATIDFALGIESPSKVTTASGEFVGDGLIVGMANRMKDVAKGAKGLAVTAKDSINEFIQGVSIPDYDNIVHIQAVVDYDDSAISAISETFNIQPDLRFAKESVRHLVARNRQNGDNLPSQTTQTPNVTNEYKIDQRLVFQSREMTPSEVARKNLQSSRELVRQLK